MLKFKYRNDPFVGQILVNSVDPDETVVWGSTLFAFWMYYSMVKSHCSKFRIIAAVVLIVPKFLQ